MIKLARPLLIALAASSAALPSPAHAVTESATVKVNVVKPLTLTALQNLDLGTITLAGGAWSNVTVGISRAGVLSCGNANIVCSGATQVARFKVTGTNRQVVLISAPNVTLTNQSDTSQTLTMAVDKPASVTLTSSGEPGVNFDIGGSVTLSSSTADGTYAGTMNVTVDYQ
jgi:spore coat protein U-like protein